MSKATQALHYWTADHRRGTTVFYAKRRPGQRRLREAFDTMDEVRVRPALWADIAWVIGFGGRIHGRSRDEAVQDLANARKDHP